MPNATGRVRAFDWLRGAVVPLMVQCHALSLLWPGLRTDRLYKALVWLDGLVAPAFLLCAGFTLGLLQLRSSAAGHGWLQHGRTARRIGEVLVWATLVNWMWFPLLTEPRWIGRVDILHCIGLSLLAAFPATIVLSRAPRALQIVGVLVAAVCFAAAPFGEQVRGGWAMLANKSTGAVFPLLPWTGYVFLGVTLGTAYAVGGRAALVRLLWGAAVLGGLCWLLGPLLRAAYPAHDSQVTNPAEHARRLTLMTGTLLALLEVERRRPGMGQTRPARVLEMLSRRSLTAYVVHEALLYFPGATWSFFALWGRRTHWGPWLGITALLIFLTYVATLGVDRAREWMPRLRFRAAAADPG